jgi:hypothetical protein
MRRLTKAERDKARRTAIQAGIWALPAGVAGAAGGKKYAALSAAAAGTSGGLAELVKAHPARIEYTIDREKTPIPASKRRARRLRNMAIGGIEGAAVGATGALALKDASIKSLTTGAGAGATTGVVLGALKPVPMQQTRYRFEPVKAPEHVVKGYPGYLGEDGVPRPPAMPKRVRQAAAAPARTVRRVRASAQDKAARVMATGQGARVHGLNQTDVDLRYRKTFL